MQIDNKEKLSSSQREILRRWQKKGGSKVFLSQEIKDELMIKFDGEVLFDERMSKHTYIKIGGPADVFLIPKTRQALIYAVQLARENHIPYFFIGLGANTLVKDGGIRGFVISVYNSFTEYEILEKTDHHIDIRVDSGMSSFKLFHLAKDLGVCDFTPFAGIPGSVGGLISMNAGTKVREMKDVVRSIEVLSPENEILNLSRENLNFEYRHLKLSKTHFILSAVFRLQDFASSEDVEAQMKRYQQRRTETQPLDYPNLGSIFKNPEVKHRNETAMTAGKLIEEAGLKNVRVGAARISNKHANFIVNEGEAMASDVIALVNMIKDKVKMTSGVSLETEIKVIGEELEVNE